MGGQQRASADEVATEAGAGGPQPSQPLDEDVHALARVVPGHRHDQGRLAARVALLSKLLSGGVILAVVYAIVATWALGRGGPRRLWSTGAAALASIAVAIVLLGRYYGAERSALVPRPDGLRRSYRDGADRAAIGRGLTALPVGEAAGSGDARYVRRPHRGDGSLDPRRRNALIDDGGDRDSKRTSGLRRGALAHHQRVVGVGDQDDPPAGEAERPLQLENAAAAAGIGGAERHRHAVLARCDLDILLDDQWTIGP